MGKLWLSRLQFSVMLKGTAAHQLSEPPGDQTEGPQAAGNTRKDRSADVSLCSAKLQRAFLREL